MAKKLVGIKRFVGKDGNMYCVAIVVEPFSQRNISKGCIGSKVSEVFMPDDLYDFLTDKHIGHEIDFNYEIVGNKAYVGDVIVK